MSTDNTDLNAAKCTILDIVSITAVFDHWFKPFITKDHNYDDIVKIVFDFYFYYTQWTTWEKSLSQHVTSVVLQHENGKVPKDAFVIFDVRDKRDFVGGNIKTAKNIPHRIFGANLGNIIILISELIVA